MIDFTQLPIGTRVMTVEGPGTISQIDKDSTYPIQVLLDEPIHDPDFSEHPQTTSCYTQDGKYYSKHLLPTLFVMPFDWPNQENQIQDLIVRLQQFTQKPTQP